MPPGELEWGLGLWWGCCPGEAAPRQADRRGWSRQDSSVAAPCGRTSGEKRLFARPQGLFLVCLLGARGKSGSHSGQVSKTQRAGQMTSCAAPCDGHILAHAMFWLRTHNLDLITTNPQ